MGLKQFSWFLRTTRLVSSLQGSVSRQVRLVECGISRTPQSENHSVLAFALAGTAHTEQQAPCNARGHVEVQ